MPCAARRRSWNARPLVRSLYVSWFKQICTALSPVDGRSIELGSGIATLPETCPRVEPTDVELGNALGHRGRRCRGAPLRRRDAREPRARRRLPSSRASRAFPGRGRTYPRIWRSGRGAGPVLLTRLYTGLQTLPPRANRPVGRAVRRRRIDRRGAACFEPVSATTLAFFRHADELAERWPQLRIVERRRLAVLAYPLSGGFTGRQLVPAAVGRGLARLGGSAGLSHPFACLSAASSCSSAAAPDAHHLDAELPEAE